MNEFRVTDQGELDLGLAAPATRSAVRCPAAAPDGSRRHRRRLGPARRRRTDARRRLAR